MVSRQMLAAGLVAITMAGCSAGPPATPGPTAAATPTAGVTVAPTVQPMAQLAGVYTTTITQADLTGHVSSDEYCENEGVFTLTLSASGEWRQTQAVATGCSVSTTQFDGTFELSAGQIKFRQAQPDCGSVYIYGYALTSTTLAFTKVLDSCGPRAAIYTAHLWVRT